MGHIERSGNNSRRVTGYRCTSLDCLDCRPLVKKKIKDYRQQGNERGDRQDCEAVVLGGQITEVGAGETCRSWRGVGVR